MMKEPIKDDIEGWGGTRVEAWGGLKISHEGLGG